MPRLEPPSNAPADLEAALRRQLRWIEDDIVIAVLGPDAASVVAPQPAGTHPAPLAATPAHSRGLWSRLRHRANGLLRRLFRIRRA